MGKTKANAPPQSVVVRTEKSEGESGVYRCPQFQDNLMVTFDNLSTIPELLRYSTEKFANREYLGYRELYPDGSRGEFSWHTYKEVMEQSQHMACGLANLGAKPGDKIGFYSINTYEWKIGEYGCYLNSFAVVSLYDSLGPTAVDFIVNHADIEIIFCSNTVLPKLFAAFEKMSTCKVRHVIVFDVSNRVSEFPAGERKRRQTISKEPPPKAEPAKEDDKKQRRHTIAFGSSPFKKEPSKKDLKKEEPKKVEEKKEEPKKEEKKPEQNKSEEKKEDAKEGEAKKEKKHKKKKEASKEEPKKDEAKEESKAEEKKDEEKKEENNNNAEKKEEEKKDEASPGERKKKKKKSKKTSEEGKKEEEKKDEEPKKEEEKKPEEKPAEEEPKKEEEKEVEKKDSKEEAKVEETKAEEKPTEPIKPSKTEGAQPTPVSPPASPAPVPFDPHAPIIPDEFRKKAEDLKITLHLFSDILRNGKEQPSALISPKTEDLCSIMYTSGTTGVPKGVILTHKNLLSALAGFHTADARATELEVTYLSYLPLAHIMERVSLLNWSYRGGKIGFFSGDTKKLLEDFAVLKPSVIVGAPRVFQRIYDKVMGTVENSPNTKKWLFKKAYEDKKKALKEGKDTPVWNALVFNKIAESVLGGKVELIISGSAPLSETVAEFLRIVFTKDVREGYGLTETTAACSIQLYGDKDGGKVGPPLSICEIKLMDVPELKYTAADKPCPRGEICMKGAFVTSGYYKDEEKTREIIDADGWFHSGDIGRINEDGTLSIIDRKKNIFKLSIGEYVAPEYLENVYCRASFVSQCFVYGNSFENCLIGVIVPDPDIVAPWAEKLGKQFDMKALMADPDLKKAVVEEITRIGKSAKLLSYEFLKDIILESEPFSVDNELLTPTFKLKRVDAYNKYKSTITEKYAAINEQARQAEKEKEQTKD